MKRKFFYLMIVCCALSMISSAGRKKGRYCKYAECSSSKTEKINQDLSQKEIGTALGFSPFQFLVF